jgi:hypothetical protein
MNASLWTELQVWFALRGLRERAIVLIAVLVALGYGWQFLVKDGLEQYVQTEIRNLAQLQSSAQRLTRLPRQIRIPCYSAPLPG